MAASISENRSLYRLRWIGYGFLVFAITDTLQALIPLQLTNPAWELQTIGLLVERVSIPLIGLALVFIGEHYERAAFEKPLLRVLSWLCLVLAIIFLLMIPIGVLGTARLDTLNEQQMNSQIQRQLSQLNQFEERLDQSQPEAIKNLGTRLGVSAPSANSQDPEQVKTKILSKVDQTRSQVQVQSQSGRANQRFVLFKNSIKWNIGSLIASALFLFLWKSTDWARQGR